MPKTYKDKAKLKPKAQLKHETPVRNKRQRRGGRRLQNRRERHLIGRLPESQGALNNPKKKFKANTSEGGSEKSGTTIQPKLGQSQSQGALNNPKKRQRDQNVNSRGAEAKGQPPPKKPKIEQAVQHKPRKVKTKRQRQAGGTVQKLKKISDVWKNVKIEGEWVQSYHTDKDPTKSTRYVMLKFDDGWHISFYPKDPNDPSEAEYREAAKNGFENEVYADYADYDVYAWRKDNEMMDELEFDEFHVTSPGILHQGTSKHFFYKADGTFDGENGIDIDDNDRKYADKLRLQIVPSAPYPDYGAYKGQWPPDQQTLADIVQGKYPLIPSRAYLEKMKKIGEIA